MAIGANLANFSSSSVSYPSDDYSATYHYSGIGDGDEMDWSAPGRISNTMDGTAAQNQFNAEQAQIQREHELYMSNTAYQRAVADMQAAGLNPASLSGLAASGSGASGSSSSSASAASKKDSSIIGTILKLLGTFLLIK